GVAGEYVFSASGDCLWVSESKCGCDGDAELDAAEVAGHWVFPRRNAERAGGDADDYDHDHRRQRDRHVRYANDQNRPADRAGDRRNPDAASGSRQAFRMLYPGWGAAVPDFDRDRNARVDEHREWPHRGVSAACRCEYVGDDYDDGR